MISEIDRFTIVPANRKMLTLLYETGEDGEPLTVEEVAESMGLEVSIVQGVDSFFKRWLDRQSEEPYRRPSPEQIQGQE